MSNNEENFANPVVKSIIDEVTNEVVGVALLHNVPGSKTVTNVSKNSYALLYIGSTSIYPS